MTMEIDPSHIPSLSREEVEELKEKYPEQFLELCKLMADLHLHLAKKDINWFIPYVLRWEGKNTPVVQSPHHVALQRHIDENPYSLIWGGVGIGKAQPLDSLVRTPDGWKRIGDLKKGSEILDPISPGHCSRVAKIHGPSFEQVVEVRTATGRSTQCSIDHLWVVRVGEERVGRIVRAAIISQLLIGRTQPVKVPAYQSGKLLWEEVASVNSLGSKLCACLSLEGGSRLYITDSWLVTHNCVTEDTLFIDESWRPVTALDLMALLRAGRTPKVLDIDPATLREEFVPVRSVSEDATVPIQQITAESRAKLRVSGNHPVLAKQHPRAQFQFVEASDLVPWARVVTCYPRLPSLEYIPEAFALGCFLGGASRYFTNRWVLTHTPHGLGEEGANFLDMGKQASRLFHRLQKTSNIGTFLDIRPSAVGSWVQVRWPSLAEGLSLRHELESTTIKGRWYRHRIQSPRKIPVPACPRSWFPSICAGIFAATARKVPPRRNLIFLEITQALADALVWMLRCSGFPSSANPSSLSVFGIAFHDLYAQEFLNFIERHVDHLASHARKMASKLEAASVRWRAHVLARDRKFEAVGFSGYSSMPAVHDRKQAAFAETLVGLTAQPPEKTYAVEVASERHTFLTDWILTHNTQQVTIARSLFWLGKNPNARILIVMASQNNHAKDVLRQIKNYITGSEAYQAVFPHVKPGGKWAEFEIMIERPEASVTPSIRIAGISTAIIGARFDYIIGDDFLDRENTASAAERANVFHWLVSTPLSRLARNSTTVLIGNAWHADDAMHRLESMPNSQWAALRIPARDPKTGASRFPDIITQEQIDTWTKTRPPGEVRRAFDCVPWTNASSRYRIEWFDASLKAGCGIHEENGQPVVFRTYYDVVEEQEKAYVSRAKGLDTPIPMMVVAGIDQGFGQTERSDLTAISIGVLRSDDSFVLLDYKAARLSETEKVAEVLRAHEKFGATIFVETTFTQRWFYEHIRKVAPSVVIFPWNTRGTGEVGNKHHAQYGIASLEVLFQAGKIILPSIPNEKSPTGYITDEAIANLVEAFMTYEPDTWAHTHDGIMSLWIMTQGARLRFDASSIPLPMKGVGASMTSSIDASSIWGANSPWAEIKRRMRS